MLPVFANPKAGHSQTPLLHLILAAVSTSSFRKGISNPVILHTTLISKYRLFSSSYKLILLLLSHVCDLIIYQLAYQLASETLERNRQIRKKKKVYKCQQHSPLTYTLLPFMQTLPPANHLNMLVPFIVSQY